MQYAQKDWVACRKLSYNPKALLNWSCFKYLRLAYALNPATLNCWNTSILYQGKPHVSLIPKSLWKGEAYIDSVFSLTSSYELSNTRHKHVHGRHSFAVVIHPHVERLDFCWIIIHNHWCLANLLSNVSLMLTRQIIPPLYLKEAQRRISTHQIHKSPQ